MTDMKTKRCTCCGQTKDHGDFANHPQTRDGLQSWCMDCSRAYGRAYYAMKKAERLAKERAAARPKPAAKTP